MHIVGWNMEDNDKSKRLRHIIENIQIFLAVTYIGGCSISKQSERTQEALADKGLCHKTGAAEIWSAGLPPEGQAGASK